MRRRGAALLYVIVLGLIILGTAGAVIRWLMQRNHQSAKNLSTTLLSSDLAGLRSVVSTCLAAAGYPTGSCAPTPAQAACLPVGADITFSGTPPACEFKISVSR